MTILRQLPWIMPHLNEVLSIRAQELPTTMRMAQLPTTHLNEVLSIRAQEFVQA